MPDALNRTVMNPPPPQDFQAWGKPEITCPALLAESEVSFTANGQALSILFPRLRVDLQMPDQPLSSQAIVCIAVPVNVPEGNSLEGFTVDFRGFVSKTAGARAVLLADAGGVPRTLEFPFDQAKQSNFTIGQLQLDGAIPAEGAAAPPPGPCCLHLALLVQRRTAQEAVLFALDSIDVAAIFGQVLVSQHAPKPVNPPGGDPPPPGGDPPAP